MDIITYFRKFFGLSDRERESTGEFRNPIWGEYTDEDEEDLSMSTNRSFGFPIYSDPMNMESFFQQQLDEIMRHFSGMHFHSTPDVFSFPGVEKFSELPNSNSSPSLRDRYLKESTGDGNKPEDVDLDGKINVNDVHDLLVENVPPPSQSRPIDKKNNFFSKSVVIQKIRKADGVIETRKTVRDSTGREETTITTSDYEPGQTDPDSSLYFDGFTSFFTKHFKI